MELHQFSAIHRWETLIRLKLHQSTAVQGSIIYGMVLSCISVGGGAPPCAPSPGVVVQNHTWEYRTILLHWVMQISAAFHLMGPWGLFAQVSLNYASAPMRICKGQKYWFGLYMAWLVLPLCFCLRTTNVWEIFLSSVMLDLVLYFYKRSERTSLEINLTYIPLGSYFTRISIWIRSCLLTDQAAKQN